MKPCVDVSCTEQKCLQSSSVSTRIHDAGTRKYVEHVSRKKGNPKKMVRIYLYIFSNSGLEPGSPAMSRRDSTIKLIGLMRLLFGVEVNPIIIQ
jgi:hypothetical protein